MKKITKKVILGIVENQKQEILLTQRFEPDIPDAHLKWDIIGGSQEKDEDKEETVKRECLEESGYKIKVIYLLPKSIARDWNHKEYIIHVDLECFYCRFISGKIKTNDHKIQNLQWTPKKDVLVLDLLPTTKEFLEFFLVSSLDSIS